MDLHEYQSKQLMLNFGIKNLLKGFLIKNKNEISSVLNTAFSEKNIIVVKAQVHAGGRGKAGGVKVCKSVSDAYEYSQRLLGSKLVTKQTSKEGQYVSALYCEEGCDIDKEFYLSVLIDRENKCISMVISTEGGMDIEEVAHNNPDKINTIHIDSLVGYMPFQTRKVLYFLGLDFEKYFNKLHELLFNLYNFFIQKDLSLLEINPLVLTKESNENPGDFIILDAKVNVEDNGLFRHKDIALLRDKTQEDPLESKAKDMNLSYVKLDGSIGCMVNGAGLAMATMDIIQYYGKKPANFLDVGGGADESGVKTALNIIIEDKSVERILINIFGGIVRCDMIAQAIVGASKSLISEGKNIPLMVVRLSGTNSELGSKIIKESGLNITPAFDLDDAAKKVVCSVN